MSESHNPTDTQGLLQSMLQRLKLQPGREGQSFPHTPGTTTATSTGSQDGDSEAANSDKFNIHPVNGFGFVSNGIPSKQFGVSAAHSYDGEMQQPHHVPGLDEGLTSSPSLKDNTDNDIAENRVLDDDTPHGIPPTGTGQLFPAESPKGHDITSFEETNGQRGTTSDSTAMRHISGDEDAVTHLGQNQIREQESDQGYTPKVYTWSLKPTHVNEGSGTLENKVLHVGNGGIGDLGQRTDVQCVASSQTATHSSLRRKQQSSENKTWRWTQKIKERWLDRPGSFGKKGKATGGNVDQRVAQGAQEQAAENLISTVSREEGRILLSLGSSDPGENSTEERLRTSSDFDLGLGSFSLLDEIVTGQEWATFLNPDLPASAANQTLSEQLHGQHTSSLNSQDSGQSSLILNQQGGGSSQRGFGTTESSAAPKFSPAQASLDALQPVSMDVSEVKQQQDVHTAADRLEPMEDEQSGERGRRTQHRPPSFVEPSDTGDNSALRKVPLSRKRQHQSAGRDQRLHTEKTGDEKKADQGVSSLSVTQSHVMNETQHDAVVPLNTPDSPPTPFYPSFKPFAPARRGALKQSMSMDSESSMETETKRRRVEDNRRVHFSEEVVTIDPPELDEYVTDSEEDSGADNDSVIEQESEQERAVIQEAAAGAGARRLALPAWIKALKRRSTGKKHTYRL